MTDAVSVTLWATNTARPFSGPQEWLEGLDRVAAESADQGSALLVLPEYVSEQWLTFATPGLTPQQEPTAMAETGLTLLSDIQAIADRRGIDILAGSWPVAAAGGGYHNVAHLFSQGGTEPFLQPKLCLTPSEKDPAAWSMTPAQQMTVFQWRGLNCAIIICLDIELPALSARLAKEAPDLDIIFCPSMTERLSGYSRVFGCAKARAVELLCAVCVVGVIGETPLGDGRPNVSGAAVYLPCEKELGYDGVFASVGPYSETPADDPLGPRLHAKDIPVGVIRALRQSQPEVWPGAWSDAGVTIAAAKA